MAKIRKVFYKIFIGAVHRVKRCLDAIKMALSLSTQPNWLQRRFCWVAAALLMGGLPFLTPNTASAHSCSDVFVVFARGSGDSLNGADYQAWQSAIQQEAASAYQNLKFAYYELGSAAQGGAQYPATAVGFDSAEATLTTLGAVIDISDSLNFNQSVQAGVTELTNFVRATLGSCPNTRFVLGGYSQGAMVISQALPELPADRILYAATLGDPQLYLPEGAPRLFDQPLACTGQNLSPYRVNVPECSTYQGVLGGKIPYVTQQLSTKTGTWCYGQDFMCGAKLNLGQLLDDHLSYKTSSAYQEVANKVRAQLDALYPHYDPIDHSLPDYKIIIDTRRLADASAQEFLINKISELAQTNVVPGQVRLGVYLWHEASLSLYTLLALDSDGAEINASLASIPSLTNGDSWPERRSFASLGSAVRYLIDTDPWLTHSFAGIEYVNDNPDLVNAELASNGFFTESKFPDTISATTIGYSYSIEEPFKELLAHSTTQNNLTKASRITTNINSPNANSGVAQIDGITGTIDGDTAQITFTATNAEFVLLVANGALLGQVNQRQFTLTGLSSESELTLIPYNAAGERGSVRTLTLPLTSDTQKVQNGNLTALPILAPNTGKGSPFGRPWFKRWSGGAPI